MNDINRGGISVSYLTVDGGEAMSVIADNGYEVRYIRQGAGGPCPSGTAARLFEWPNEKFTISFMPASEVLDLLGTSAKIILNEADFDELADEFESFGTPQILS